MENKESIESFHHIYTGKVRDIYQNDSNQLLFVATDRISAYDWVLPSEIPDKGKILTQLTLWWLEQLSSITNNHLISTQVPQAVVGRAMIVKKLEMLPIECVVRGHLSGSGWVEYQKTQEVCGNPLPKGLKESSILPEPIFTPATKAELGEHDENISFEQAEQKIGSLLATELKLKSIQLFTKAREIADARNLILADTKFEFGLDQNNQITLADEVLTPDSSRYWPKVSYQPGRAQNSFDKQFVRDWLTSKESGWDRNSNTPPPTLPEEIIHKTREKYLEVYQLLTGEKYE
jgi:phosphoribosylaminoimidazole-succinocarboxamide synthase